MSAREEILRRIRTGLAASPPDAADTGPAGQAPQPSNPASADPEALVDRFLERVADYSAEVVRAAADDVAGAVREACARHGAHALAFAPGVPDAWRGAELTWSTEPLSVADLDRADGVLTAAATAIAETGTILLDHRPDQGRRALTLIPDLHVCVVGVEQLVATVPAALARLRGPIEEGRPVTLISGPSATSDIELERVEGVHGPRRLVVVVTGGR